MRALVVTEKCGPEAGERDGGSRLVATLRRAFGDAIAIAQFGPTCSDAATWHFAYPSGGADRFARRLANAAFVANHVRELAPAFTHVLFVHVSMQFGFTEDALAGVECWTFPMFLTPSYLAAGEVVPDAYTHRERAVLAVAERIITPSHFERRQLVDFYGVPARNVRVVPRGIDMPADAARVRELGGEGALRLCSVGSIKRQKNTRGLLRAFAGVRARHGDAKLIVVGGVQDDAYGALVRADVGRLGLGRSVDFVGHVEPRDLPAAIANAHLHVSASSCETFGRSIFETLALGLPNVALAPCNAASEYLSGAPYSMFLPHVDDIPAGVDALIEDLPQRSALASEVGVLFDDDALGQILAAELRGEEAIAVSDWDGTLFHKDDHSRTRTSIDAFRRFRVRAICTARPVIDVVSALERHDLTVDWIVGFGGAVIADGHGREVWLRALDAGDIAAIGARLPDARCVRHDDDVVQISTASKSPLLPLGYRTESYQGITFVSQWECSKLRGVRRLLRHVGWLGRVRAFGDGIYDDELLTFFDGARVHGGRASPSSFARVVREVGDVDL